MEAPSCLKTAQTAAVKALPAMIAERIVAAVPIPKTTWPATFATVVGRFRSAYRRANGANRTRFQDARKLSEVPRKVSLYRVAKGLRCRHRQEGNVYHPKITECPTCSSLKSPLSTVCSACYLRAKRDPELKVNSTRDLEAWVEFQHEKLRVSR